MVEESGSHRRLVVAGMVLATIVVAGSAIYYQIGDGRWSFVDCVYMVVITLSTVGFAETLPGMRELPEARLFTVLLILMGTGTLLYFISNLTAVFVEGDLQGILRRRSMQKTIAKLRDHIVVCGVGTTGIHVIEELVAIGMPFVAVDADIERLRRVQEDVGHEFPFVVGDATDDHTLLAAGVEQARGVVCSLHDDKDNLFVTITARALNAKARIVAKGIEVATEPKLRRAGADRVVSPNQIGGMRLVNEMLRPVAVEYLDRMLRGVEQKLRIDEIPIPEVSPLRGRPLRESRLREDYGALVIALRTVDHAFHYNPESDTVIEAGMTLIVLAKSDDVLRLHEEATGGVA